MRSGLHTYNTHIIAAALPRQSLPQPLPQLCTAAQPGQHNLRAPCTVAVCLWLWYAACTGQVAEMTMAAAHGPSRCKLPWSES